jgi:curli production assembly/transport component CsgE
MQLSWRIDSLFRFLALSTLTVATAAYPAAARAAQASAAESTPHVDAWGLVTCQAVTVAGHEFCDYLGVEWRDKPGSERYTIAIRERPSARWGSQVWIDFAQRRVYQAQLPPARAGLKELGASAAESVYQAILEVERQRQFIRDADLAPDEF